MTQHIPDFYTEISMLEPFLGKPDSENGLSWPNFEDMEQGKNCSVQFMSEHMAVCKEKNFFITRDGYMGLGPLGTEPGDRICVLLGCDVPLLIRPEDNHYVVVGACYVYGMMKGEVMHAARKGVLKTVQLEFW
jgi:hypothetical protein